MAANRHLQLRDRHRAGPYRAAIAGATASAIALVVPVELLEVAVASAGLSEAVPALAPPLDWVARIGVALLIGLMIAALFWAFSGLALLLGRRKMTIAWPRGLSWDSLTRIARGIDNDGAYTSARGGRDRFFEKPAFAQPVDWRPRRSADLHPDAPPRPPIMASRDLPAIESEPRPVRVAARGAEAPMVSVSALLADTGARAMPRSPEPLSETQLDSIRDLLASQVARAEASWPAGPTPKSVAPVANESMDDDTDILSLTEADMLFDEAPLTSLLDRFEQQVERKIAINDAVNATSRIEARIDMPTAPEPSTSSEAPREIDTALRTALETLRALSEQGRKR